VTVAAIIAWIQVIQSVYQQGDEAVSQLKAVIRQRGIEADNATLDGIIADAEVRKAREDARIAAGQPPAEG
jgi:predicted DNA-binding protein with PD1-like motif